MTVEFSTISWLLATTDRSIPNLCIPLLTASRLAGQSVLRVLFICRHNIFLYGTGKRTACRRNRGTILQLEHRRRCQLAKPRRNQISREDVANICLRIAIAFDISRSLAWA